MFYSIIEKTGLKPKPHYDIMSTTITILLLITCIYFQAFHTEYLTSKAPEKRNQGVLYRYCRADTGEWANIAVLKMGRK